MHIIHNCRDVYVNPIHKGAAGSERSFLCRFFTFNENTNCLENLPSSEIFHAALTYCRLLYKATLRRRNASPLPRHPFRAPSGWNRGEKERLSQAGSHLVIAIYTLTWWACFVYISMNDMKFTLNHLVDVIMAPGKLYLTCNSKSCKTSRSRETVKANCTFWRQVKSHRGSNNSANKTTVLYFFVTEFIWPFSFSADQQWKIFKYTFFLVNLFASTENFYSENTYGVFFAPVTRKERIFKYAFRIHFH